MTALATIAGMLPLAFAIGGRLADAANHWPLRWVGGAAELHGAVAGVYSGHKLLLATENRKSGNAECCFPLERLLLACTFVDDWATK